MCINSLGYTLIARSYKFVMVQQKLSLYRYVTVQGGGDNVCVGVEGSTPPLIQESKLTEILPS